MPVARIKVDGLWRCLCPSYDAVALTRPLSLPHRPRRAKRRSAADKTCAGARRHIHRYTDQIKHEEDIVRKKEGGRDTPAVSAASAAQVKAADEQTQKEDTPKPQAQATTDSGVTAPDKSVLQRLFAWYNEHFDDSGEIKKGGDLLAEPTGAPVEGTEQKEEDTPPATEQKEEDTHPATEQREEGTPPATEQKEEDIPRATDSAKKTPVSLSRGHPSAWKGNIRVAYDKAAPMAIPQTKQGPDPLAHVFGDVFADEEAQTGIGPESINRGQGVSHAAAGDPFNVMFDALQASKNVDFSKPNDFGEGPSKAEGADTTADPFNVMFDALQASNTVNFSKPNDFGEGPSTAQRADTSKEPWNETIGANAVKAPVASSHNAGHQQRDDAPRTDEKNASAEAVGSDSTAYMPARDGAKPAAQEATNGEDQKSPNMLKKSPKRSAQRGDLKMIERLKNLDVTGPFYVPSNSEHWTVSATDMEIHNTIHDIRMSNEHKHKKGTAYFVKLLLSRPGVKPNAFLYDTLFRAHSMPEGSVDVVYGLIKEMRNDQVRWSSNAYHSVLRLLAIHPDYLVRTEMIKEMKGRWIEINPRGHIYIAIGLLRDEQFELALEKLEETIQRGIPVDPWVYDIFVYVFGKAEFFDDALRIVRYRADKDLPISVNVWYYLLDVCSKGQHHEATTYVWNRTVPQGIVNPADGVALNILNMAAVYGDTVLAVEVIQFLAERGTRLSRPHFEALADAFSMVGNMERAVEVYCIMYGAGAEVDQASVGTLCQAMTNEPDLVDKAVEAMSTAVQKYKVPIGVYNAVLKAMVNSTALPADDAAAKGLDLYRRIRDFVPSGPTAETFHSLLQRCTRPDVAQFLAGEMVAFNIREGLGIMELMFAVHVDHDGRLYRAKIYFYKIAPHLRTSTYARRAGRWQAVMDLALRLVKRLIVAADPEAWRILEICRRHGLGDDKIAALREEVEAGRLAVVDEEPKWPEVQRGVWPGTMQHPTTTDLLQSSSRD